MNHNCTWCIQTGVGEGAGGVIGNANNLLVYHLEGRVDELNDTCELGKIKMHVPDYPTL